MTEKHVGRLLVAALHQALADHLPDRLEFYEHWLEARTLRDGALRPAPFSAVVGFLRAEGERYEPVVSGAGALAADWAVADLSGARRRIVGRLPRPWRVRAALRLAGRIARDGARTNLDGSVRRDRIEVGLGTSLFCEGRVRQPVPRCGFYLALVRRTLEHFDLPSAGRIEACRAVGDDRCRLVLELASPTGDAVPVGEVA